MPDSPRNAVADQLQNMTLVNLSEIPMSPLSPADDVMRKKKPKLEDKARVDGGTSLDEHLADANLRKTLDGRRCPEESIFVNALPVRRKEIPETPEAQQPRILFDATPALAQQVPTASIPATLSQQSGAADRTSKAGGRTGQSHRRNKSPSPPHFSTLTWQDSEITGHLADPAKDPDDDGTGLNGIGFRPTPAMAYARAQRRRQQVLDWKAREAREARAKRSERRRRGVGGTSSREATVERDIRAADSAVTFSVTPSSSDVVSRRTVKFAM